MKRKKILSLVFALIMVMTLKNPFPVEAAGDQVTGIPYKGTSFQTTALVALPTVDVDVPTDPGVIIVNPYGLTVGEAWNTWNKGAARTELSDINLLETEDNPDDPEAASSAQIISAARTITNRTVVPLRMSVAVSGNAADGISFSPTPVSESTKTKKVFIYLIFKQHSNEWYDDQNVPYAEYSETAADQILLKKTSETDGNVSGVVKKKDFMTLSAPRLGEANYVSFQAFGNCSPNPTGGWTETDTVGMTIAFNFKLLPSGSA